MDTKDITLHLKLAKFTNTLSRTQRIDFSSILQCIEDRYDNDDSVHKGAVLKNKLPTSDSELRNLYLVGKNAILQNLPRPSVIVQDDHSYVSIRQCIQHFLSEGRMPHKISTIGLKDFNLLTESPSARLILQRAKDVNSAVDKNNLFVMLGIQWSDAFDPNSSIKANRGAVWIKTVTFVLEDFYCNEMQDTYPICIGHKNACHDIVEQKFVNELNNLALGINNVFYSKQLS